MAASLLSASCNLFLQDSHASMANKALPVASRLPGPCFDPNVRSSLYGSPLLIRVSSHTLQPTHRARSVSVRCEQSAGNSVDVWLGRVAMVGFAVAISVEIATGKGLLENFGVASPLPTAALAVTALVGILTAVFIFQSASKN